MSAPSTAADVDDSAFSFRPRTQLFYGAGSFNRLSDTVREHGGRRVLLVTDPGLRHAGHSDRAEQMLRDAGLTVSVFDDVCENPTTDDVDRCVRFAKPLGIDIIVGLGGGSSLDCAKGANFLLTNGGRMHDYRGIGKATKPMLPMIAVPTTSGTGSEAQSFAVIADAETHIKMPCGDVKAACKAAILDPELTLTMPHAVATATGIDAMTHAVESYVTVRRNPISRMFAREAWCLLSTAFPAILDDPNDLDARGQMQLGAWFAGSAIENSMLGAAHGASNPITAKYGTVHGVCVGLLLPHVIRWNAGSVGHLYKELTVASGWLAGSDDGSSAAAILADRFTELLTAAAMPVTLSQAISDSSLQESLPTLAALAAQQWTGTFNPRKMDEAGYLQIYRNAV